MARPLSTSGSGSVNHPSNFIVGIELSVFISSTVASSSDGARLACLADSRAHAWVGISDCGLGALETGILTSSLLPSFNSRPESRRDYPPNLSILISGGKENNRDTLSNGE